MGFTQGWVGPAVKMGMAGYAAYSAIPRGNYSRSSNVGYSTGATSVSRRRVRVGRSKKWNVKKAKINFLASGRENILRFQNVSQTYLGPGKVFIGWSKGADANVEQFPLHLMSLSHCGPFGASDIQNGCWDHVGRRYWYNNTTQSMFGPVLSCQNQFGNLKSDSNWDQERIDIPAGLVFPSGGKMYHKYSNIRLNLYGTLEVPITYRVMVCQIVKDFDPFVYANGEDIPNGANANDMLRDLARTCLYENTGSNGMPAWKKHVRIIKQVVETINPPPKTDAAAYNADQTAATIRSLDWLIRHDRFRNYKWDKSNATRQHDADFKNGGWDMAVTSNNLCEVDWGQRVYLLITASSPQPANPGDFSDPDGQQFATAATQKYQGSYDIVIRNAFRYFQ